ncbi:hemolysin-III related [Kordia sp. SMS9]|uniref:PAQR family membrane homeostasis protein TrhA n=1 Tax=Kordia sp. SMS9 TaxID=2282170 RepID=UPI000E0D0857|nr:hemolysin III family protein [Kordia sp. SMS9]AXG68543.1 hemolysin-III related [Kordia sp. SMS9]
MKPKKEAVYYSPLEEKLNIISHAIGVLLGIVALIFLVIHGVQNGTAVHVVSFTIYGASIIILYLASTLYHKATSPILRNRLRIFDHAAIYVLIAGTYTPYALVTLEGTIGWTIFGLAWGFAIVGITMKLFFTGKFDKLSTLMYVFMGWIIIFAINPLIANLSSEGLFWLFAGGIFYTVGAILYSIRQLPFNHAIFHVFVLAGSACHFVSVYAYVL